MYLYIMIKAEKKEEKRKQFKLAENFGIDPNYLRGGIDGIYFISD